MRKKIAILLAIVMVVGLSVMGLARQEKAYAKTAQMRIEIPESIKKENEFKVKVVLDSDVNLYSIDAYLSYDANLLEFVPDNDKVTGSAGILEIKDTYEAETKKAEYELTFKALDTGKAQILFSEVYLIDYADMDYIEVVPSAKSFHIGVNKTVAMDARLADLIVAPGELTEEFDPSQLDYEMHVGLDVDMVGISAVPMDEGSVVESEIPEKLQLGENIITIKVTALSGSVNVYTVKVYKEEITEEVTEEAGTEAADDSSEQTTEQPATEGQKTEDESAGGSTTEQTTETEEPDQEAVSEDTQAVVEEENVTTEQTTEISE